MVSHAYFRFQTNAQIKPTLSTLTVTPNVAICARYTDILMYDRLERETGIIRRRSSVWQEVLKTQSMLSQIFHLTPSADKLLSRAGIRRNDSFLLSHCVSSRDCTRAIFNVSKFFLQEFMCYRIAFQREIRTDADMAAFAGNSRHILLSVHLSPDVMSGADALKVIVHTGQLPHLSKDYAPIVDRFSDFDARTIHTNSFAFSYATSQVSLKQAPYDTDCQPVSGRSRMDHHMCMLRLLPRLAHRVPFTGILLENRQMMDVPHLSYYDLTNHSMARLVQQTEQRCSLIHRQPACDFDFTITTLHQSKQVSGTAASADKLLIKIRSPSAPGTMISVDAKIKLSAYLVYVVSCISFWFGFSVASLHALLRRKWQ